MNPNQLCHCNHIEKGMIFLRIGGGMSNLEPMGKNPCVTTLFDFPIFPCLIQLPF